MCNRPAWRRCAACGQPTLVPATARAHRQRGSPTRSIPPAPTPADLNLPPHPRAMDLSPADDAVARCLLASIFPEGVKL